MMHQDSDSRGSGRLATVACGVFVASCVATASAQLYAIRVVDAAAHGRVSIPAMNVAGALVAGLAALHGLAFIVTAIAVGRWIYVVNRAAHAWSTQVSVTPGWAVGWFFVPITNLLKPFTGVRETYQASIDPDAPARVPVPAVMRLWWGGWLTGNAMVVAELFLAQRPGLTAVVFDLAWHLAATAVFAVQALAFMAVIGLVVKAQRGRVPHALGDVFS